MAKYDETRFYWLQLKEDFFDEDAIQWLEEQENGVAQAYFYIKLCVKSLKSNGVLVRRVGDMIVPYEAKRLAAMTGTDVSVVQVALVNLVRCGLVRVLENGELYLERLEEMIGAQSKGAFKKQQQRRLRAESAAQIEPPKVVDMGVDKCPPEIELELEKEKEKEKEKDSLPCGSGSLFEGAESDSEGDASCPYSDIVMDYNDKRGSLPKVTKLTDARRKTIAARWKEGYRLEDFKTVFEKAGSSNFLQGKTGGTFAASFDWLMKPSNFLKTLEGNYDNKETYNHENPERLDRTAPKSSDPSYWRAEAERFRNEPDPEWLAD